MSNTLNENLMGRVVRFKQADLRVPAEEHPFLVTGGFGASAFTRGSALTGVFLSDGERAKMNGWMVEAVLDEADLTEAQAARLEEERV